MNIDDIISVSGKPGLYKVIAQAKNGLVVEALSNKKRMPVHASQQVSALADIRIYTDTEEVELKEVFKNIFKNLNGQIFENLSDINILKENFEKALPNYDKDRVYNSDIKKVFKWYNELLSAGILKEEKEEKEEKAEEKKAKPAKKSASKNSGTKKTTVKKPGEPKAEKTAKKTTASKSKKIASKKKDE
jgi:hypothetical protein